ncbi:MULTISPECIES: condensation domain-containing protein [unclassified Micromonospora]|uniref:condensation domain-containing protein n=1 Tax=unclassified Micromonospora TaxID=2617518 RepID=UPI00363B118F
MSDRTDSGPLTFGQLYIWRNAEPYPAEMLGEVNLTASVAVPAGVGLPAVTEAIAVLERRHDVLRTRYDVHERTGLPYQIVQARTGGAPAVVDGDRANIGRFVAEAGTWSQSSPLDPTAGPPWRVTVTVVDGRPTHVVLVAHHVMLDWISLERLRAELAGLLAGRPPAGSTARPLDIARDQGSPRWAQRRAEADRYWDALLPTLPWREPPPEWAGTPPERSRWHQPVLRSAAFAGALRRLTRRLDVGGASAMEALTAVTLWRQFGWRQPVLSVMAANRWYSKDMHRALCCTAQPVPAVVPVDPDETVGDLIRRVHRAGVRAGRTGAYDLDRTHILRGRRFRRSDVLFHRQFIANYVASPQVGSAAPPEPVLSWLPGREAGPNGLLVHDEGTTASLWLRLDERLLPRSRAVRLLHAFDAVAGGLDVDDRIGDVAQHDAWSGV